MGPEPVTETSPPRLLLLLPLIAVGALIALFVLVFAQGRDPATIPSALIGRPAPTIDLPPLEGLHLPGIANADLKDGRITIVNVFASWCAPCRIEHPVLMTLAKDKRVKVIGINYKDRAEDALRFLGSLGNPYAAVGVDRTGRAAIDWGVYGVPETFVVAPDGIVASKFIGPLSEESLRSVLLPAIEKAARPTR